MPEFEPHRSIDAGIPFNFPCGRTGRYDCLNCLDGHLGVYIFQNTSTAKVLYVGQSYKQGLKARIIQHYKPGDSGGDFRINHCTIHCNLQRCTRDGDRMTACGCERDRSMDHCREICEPSCDELLSYQCFKQLLRLSEIRAFTVTGNEISAIEYDLISRLRPTYTNLPEHAPDGVEAVNDIVCSIIHSLRTPADG